MRKSEPDATLDSIVNLEIIGDESLVWIIAYTLKYIWERRTSGKIAHLNELLAEMTLDLETLQKTDKNDVATIALFHISI